MGKGAWIVGCSFCGAVVITSIVLIACSFGVLNNNELGLDYDNIGEKINTNTLFTNGRHFLGLGHVFVKYPALQQTVSYSTASTATEGPIDALTVEGLPVSLSVSFNYRFKNTITDISQLYLDYGDANAAEIVYNRVAKNWIRTVAANYTAFDFFFNRSTIQIDFQQVLNSKLDVLHANVDSFQLLDAELPTEFNAARAAQAAAFQDISVAQAQSAVAQDQARANVAVQLQNYQLLLLQAQSQAAQITAQAQATIQGLQAKYQAEKTALANLASTMGLSQKELLSYVWINAMQQAQASGITLNVEVPAVLKNVDY